MLFLTLVVAAVISIIYIVTKTFSSMYKEVSQTCQEVRILNKGDCVESMIYVVESEEYSPSVKNHAIWVLGQFADKRALPMLQSLYTGNISDEKESLDDVISQYELSKAIKWCETGNVTSWMYRNIK